MSTPENQPSPMDELVAAEAADRAGTPAEAAPAEPESPLYAGKYRNVEDLERAYEEAQRGFHQARQEAADLRRLQEQAQAYTPPQASPYDQAMLPDGTPILTPQQLEELAMENPLQAADLMARYRTFEAQAQFEAQIEPLRQQVAAQSSQTAVDQLRQMVGADLFDRHKGALASAIENDRAYYDVPPAQRLERFVNTIYAAEYKRGQGPPRDEQGRYVAAPNIEHGSSAVPDTTPTQPVDPFEREISDLRNYEVPRDAFGKKMDPTLLQ